MSLIVKEWKNRMEENSIILYAIHIEIYAR